MLTLIMVKLSSEQIENAKYVQGTRKKITHALVIEGKGQVFGTEKFCTKYFKYWPVNMGNVISHSYETDSYHLHNFDNTDLLKTIIEESKKITSQENKKLAKLKSDTSPEPTFSISHLIGLVIVIAVVLLIFL